MSERIALRWLLGMIALVVAALPLSAFARTGTPITTCVLPATPGLDPAALFAEPDRFDCSTPQRSFGRGDYWLLSQPLPPIGTHGPVNLRSDSVWQDRVTVYIRYADGATRRIGYTSRTTGPHLLLGGAISLMLPPRGALPVRLLWHVEGAANLRGIVRNPALSTHGEIANTEIDLSALYGAFVGMAIALIVYNLALWRALRQPFQLAYCVLLLCLLGYAAASSGALGQWLPGLDNNDRTRLNALFLGASAASVMLFARLFFEPRVFAGGLGRVIDGAIALTFAASVAFAVLAPWRIGLLDHLMMAALTLLILIVPAVLYRAWRQRSNFLWVFAVAWGLPITAAGLRITGAYGLTPDNVWIDNSTLMSMVVEALLSAVGIAYRIHLLARERDEARVQEAAARLLADSDPLTGLLNRRSFLAQAIGRTGPQMLLIVDLDHFKAVNETIGHDGGDEVLRLFARGLCAAVPDHALVARIGGEEFAVIVAASDGVVPSHMLDSLRGLRMPYDLTITASLGTCTGPLLKEADWKAMYRCADRALYAAKAAGRDRARAGALPVTA